MRDDESVESKEIGEIEESKEYLNSLKEAEEGPSLDRQRDAKAKYDRLKRKLPKGTKLGPEHGWTADDANAVKAYKRNQYAGKFLTPISVHNFPEPSEERQRDANAKYGRLKRILPKGTKLGPEQGWTDEDANAFRAYGRKQKAGKYLTPIPVLNFPEPSEERQRDANAKRFYESNKKARKFKRKSLPEPSEERQRAANAKYSRLKRSLPQVTKLGPEQGWTADDANAKRFYESNKKAAKFKRKPLPEPSEERQRAAVTKYHRLKRSLPKGTKLDLGHGWSTDDANAKRAYDRNHKAGKQLKPIPEYDLPEPSEERQRAANAKYSRLKRSLLQVTKLGPEHGWTADDANAKRFYLRNQRAGKYARPKKSNSSRVASPFTIPMNLDRQGFSAKNVSKRTISDNRPSKKRKM